VTVPLRMGDVGSEAINVVGERGGSPVTKMGKAISQLTKEKLGAPGKLKERRGRDLGAGFRWV